LEPDPDPLIRETLLSRISNTGRSLQLFTYPVVCVQEPISAVCIFQESLVASASQDSSVKLYNIKATIQTFSKILHIYSYSYTSIVANPGFRFFHPGSRVTKASDDPDPQQKIQVFLTKKCYKALVNMIREVYPVSRGKKSTGSRIRNTVLVLSYISVKMCLFRHCLPYGLNVCLLIAWRTTIVRSLTNLQYLQQKIQL
jgi:hypothetical protein